MSDETKTIEPFALVKERCTVAHVNVRTEIFGEDRKPAVDVKFTLETKNAVLKKLHPDLLDAHYRGDKQADIEADYKPSLKFPLIEGFSWGLEIPRVKLRLHDCDSEGNDLVMNGGKAKKFKVQTKDGGTVLLSWTVSFSQVDPDDVAKLMRVLDDDVPVSMESAAAEDEDKGDFEQQADLLTQTPMSEARKLAEKAFDQEPDRTDDLTVDQAAAAMQKAAPAAEPVAPAAEANVTALASRRPGRKVANGGMGE